jgi:hypothetical protein
VIYLKERKPITELGKWIRELIASVDRCQDEQDQDNGILIEGVSEIQEQLQKFKGDYVNIEDVAGSGYYDLEESQPAEEQKKKEEELGAQLVSLWDSATHWLSYIGQLLMKIGFDPNTPPDVPFGIVSFRRSEHMLQAAEASTKTGVWKVGDAHIEDMLLRLGGGTDKTKLTSQEEFDDEYDNWLAEVYRLTGGKEGRPFRLYWRRRPAAGRTRSLRRNAGLG